MQLSRELWSDLMKAAWVQAKGLTLGSPEDRVVQECAARLVQLLINMAGVHTTLGQPAESEKVLREALKVVGFVPSCCGFFMAPDACIVLPGFPCLCRVGRHHCAVSLGVYGVYNTVLRHLCLVVSLS